QATLPGIVVQVDSLRQYLDDKGSVSGTLLSHVLGYTGPVSGDELTQLSTQGYLPDDVIGRDGVEASFEDQLRGTYGRQIWERDLGGRLRRLPGGPDQAAPQPRHL